MVDTKISCAFDLEGTVIDVEYAHHEGHRRAASDAGVVLSMEDCFARLPHFIGGPDEEIAKEISHLALSENGKVIDYRDVLASTNEQYHHLLGELPIEPRNGFVDFFSVIQQQGLRYAIGSLTAQNQAMTLLERSGLLNLFEMKYIVLKEHVAQLKPAPDVWIETAKRAGVDPSQQIVFEDSPRGIQGAMEVGAYGIGMPVYNRPEVVNALVNAGAKRIFLNWNEINADSLLHNVTREMKESR